MNILITGSCGFIGYHLCKNLLKQKKNKIIGIDNLNSYYSVKLKKSRLHDLKTYINFSFYKIDIANKKKLIDSINKLKIDCIINLAAQAGVRYSLINPDSYIQSNLIGFFNLLEFAKNYKIKHFISASTSSVYGDNTNFPLKESEITNKPLNLYAATKLSNENLGYSYSYCFKLPITFLRFFTVYGPAGRPDMSLYKFVESAYKKTEISIFNNGNHTRDFTYVEDVVFLISKLINKPSTKKIPFNIFNIGSDDPKPLKSYIKLIEKYTGLKIKKIYLPLQIGDIKKTHASNSKLQNFLKLKFKFTPIDIGIKKFIDWYKNHNSI